MAAHIWFQLTTHFIDPERMKGWVGLVGWPIADGLPTLVVTHQLQVERRTGKVRRPETDVLPLCQPPISNAKIKMHPKLAHARNPTAQMSKSIPVNENLAAYMKLKCKWGRSCESWLANCWQNIILYTLHSITFILSNFSLHHPYFMHRYCLPLI